MNEKCEIEEVENGYIVTDGSKKHVFTDLPSAFAWMAQWRLLDTDVGSRVSVSIERTRYKQREVLYGSHGGMKLGDQPDGTSAFLIYVSPPTPRPVWWPENAEALCIPHHEPGTKKDYGDIAKFWSRKDNVDALMALGFRLLGNDGTDITPESLEL